MHEEKKIHFLNTKNKNTSPFHEFNDVNKLRKLQKGKLRFKNSLKLTLLLTYFLTYQVTLQGLNFNGWMDMHAKFKNLVEKNHEGRMFPS